MKRIFFLTLGFLAMFAAVGCHGQVPATTHQVLLTWTAPSNCTASTCTYLISRVIVTGSTCPTATTGTYKAINTGAEVTASTYTDTTAAGLTVCYIAQTDLSGAYSVASNTAGPLVVPAPPTAPSTVTGSQTTVTASTASPDGTTQVAKLELKAAVK